MWGIVFFYPETEIKQLKLSSGVRGVHGGATPYKLYRVHGNYNE